MAGTHITTQQFYAALVKAGILADGDMVKRVSISTNAYEPYVEVDIEYIADERLVEAIQELDFTPPHEHRLGSVCEACNPPVGDLPECKAKTCTRPHDQRGRHIV